MFVFYVIGKKSFIFSDFITFTLKLYQDVQLELLQDHVIFHPDQLRNVQENEVNRF